ncbi:hypothetical protein [Rhodovulum sp. PH10]|uniref:hypothetical protein n=1 Tax=Rhodovulum sp. PH10 TaxID=1187851 RepID=UPI0012F7C822|nr:hypothetical protein [Rhodovulum sp. PH10]
MGLVPNERTKLFATALNNLAVATVVTAIIAPIAGFLYGAVATPRSWWPVMGAVWFLVGIGLHLVAQLVLGRLRE